MKRVASVLLCTVLLAPAAVRAQEFRGTISGTIRDASDAPLPGVVVLVTNSGTGVTTEAVTNRAGLYVASFLIPGTYTVEASADGFKTARQENVTVNIGDRLGIDLVLEIGDVAESVNVIAQTSPLQTETGSRGGLVEEALVQNVPLAGRNIMQLTFAMPGVHKPSDAQSNSFDLVGVGNSLPSVAGSSGGVNGRQWNTEVLLDGVPNTKGSGEIALLPALGTVQEFTVLTNPYDAQYGRTGGGVLSITTKSGTNQFHGMVFDRLDDSRLAANSWARNRVGEPKPLERTHNYGFTVHGPVSIPRLFEGRDRLFFALAYDATPSNEVEQRLATVPVPAFLGGDFRGLRNADAQPVTIYDPLTTRLGPDGTYVRDPFPGNRIPADRINPVARRALGYYPGPTNAGTGPAHENNYVNHSPGDSDTSQWMARVDYRVNNRHTVFGRFIATKFDNFEAPYWGTASEPGARWRGARFSNVTLDWSAMLSPTMTVNVRGGLARPRDYARRPLAEGFDPRELGFPSSLVGELEEMTRLRFPTFNLGSYQQLGPGDTFELLDHTYSGQANVTKVVGRHLFRAGFEGRLFRSFSDSPGWPTGRYTFGRSWTQADPLRGDSASGNEIASFLLGYPSGGVIDVNFAPDFRNRYYALFLQDDWRVTDRLTLNLGLRWDYETPLVERFDRMNRGFDFGTASPLADLVRGATGAEHCLACADLHGGLLFAGANGQPRTAVNPDRQNFQPRVAFAWSLDARTVLRGGYGMFTMGQSLSGSTAGFSQQTPIVPSLDGGLTPAITLSNPAPGGLLVPAGNSLGLASHLGLPIAFNYLDRPIGEAHQVSLGIQREIFGAVVEAAYVGNFSRKLPVSASLNAIPADLMGRPETFYTELVSNPFEGLLPDNPALNGALVPRERLLLPYPQYDQVTVNGVPIGSSRYHSGQFTLARRFRGGLAFQANYTVSRDVERLVFRNPQDFNLQDPDASRLDERLTPFDVPHKLSLVGTYELPIGRGRALGSDLPAALDVLLGHWRVGWNITYQSGFPINFPNAAPIDSRSAALDGDAPGFFAFDPSVFPDRAHPRYELRDFPTRFSSDVRLMPVWNHDFSVMKDFPIRGDVRLQFRADIINAFNRPYFPRIQSLDVTSPTFGQLVLEQRNQPRTIFLDFKLLF